jgi:hypothetical protein
MITFAPFPETQRRKRPPLPRLLVIALLLALAGSGGLVILWSFLP